MNTPVDPKAAEAAAMQLPVPVKPDRGREMLVVTDPIPVLDTARFEHMQRIANVMAHSNLVPDALCKTKVGNDMVALEPQEILSNCFLVVNQAVRWGMDPFAVAQCVSVVKGKLCYEGKLIAAVLETKLGVKLEYEFSGSGDNMKVVVGATVDGVPLVDSKGRPKTIEGTVAEWKTTHTGSPWSAPGGRVRMLRYRGAREWSRVYESGTMLGVYSPDEMEALSDDNRATRAREVAPRLSPGDDEPPPPPPVRAPEPIEEAEADAEADTDAVDESYVSLAQGPADDGPPDPSSSADVEADQAQPRNSPSVDTAAPADATLKHPAGAATLSKDQLITSIGKIATAAECDPWANAHGEDMEDLSDADRREVERAFNSKSGALSRAEDKK